MTGLGRYLGLGGIGASLLLAAPAFAGDRWDWVIVPYLWNSSISSDLETAAAPPGGLGDDTHFNGILDEVDGVFQIHAEGEGDDWGAFADFTYFGLSHENDRPRFHTETDLDVRLFELAAIWSPGATRHAGLDVLAGLRYVDLDLTADLRPANPLFPTSIVKVSESYSDFMLGARYTWVWSDRWGLTLRGDGSWGQTEGTWSASAAVQYRTDGGAWYFGYRYLDGSLKANGNTLDVTMDGPEVGYGFRF